VPLTMSDYTQLVLEFFAERGFILDSHSDLFDSGALDSIGVLELVGFLECKLSIRFDASIMVMENFKTIEKICTLIRKHDA
jgi:acyl carrier protein